MNKNILTLFLSLYALTLSAQTTVQNGLVREQNSGKKNIAEVQVIFEKALDASDGAGKFRLVFADKKVGDIVFLTKIYKEGYELVNDKELEYITLTNSDKFPVDIILAEAGVVEAAKKQYYAISDEALKAGFEKEKAALSQDLQNAKMTQQEYQKKYDTLLQQYDNQKEMIEELSEKFAKVNFDDVSALYQEALQLFKDGKIDEAAKKLNGADLPKQTEKIIKERKSIEDNKEVFAEREAELDKKLNELIETIQLLADIYACQFRIDSTEIQYARLLALDSTNLDILQNCATFYKDSHRYEKALHLYPKIIAHPKAEEWQRAKAYGFMGKLYTATSDLDKAETTYFQSSEIYTRLHKNDPQSNFYKNGLAISYSKLGDTYMSLGNLDKALNFFEKRNQLSEELYKSDPNHVDFKNGLAVSYERLGDTHTSLGNLEKALNFFEKFTTLMEEFYKSDPNHVDFKNGLAVSYERLGDTHSSLGNLEKALNFFEDENKLFEEFYKSDPNYVDFKRGLAVSYEKLGSTYIALGNLDRALNFFEKYNQLSEELYKSDPNHVDFKRGLAISYSKLGDTFMALGNLDKALNFFEKFTTLMEELYKNYPNNVSFKNGLAVSYERLGLTYIALGNLDRALNFFEKFTTLMEELYKSYPNHVDFKDGLAISYYKLGTFNRDNLKDKNEARLYFTKAEALWLELVRDAPQYIEFKKFLGIVQQSLKDL